MKNVCYTVFQGSFCGGFWQTIKTMDRKIDLSPLVERVNDGVLKVDRCYVRIVGRINPGMDSFTIMVNGSEVFQASDPWYPGAKDKMINAVRDIDFDLIRYQPKVDVTLTIQKPAWIMCTCFTGTVSLCFDVEVVKKPLVGSPIPTPESPISSAAKWFIIAGAGLGAFAIAYTLVSRYGAKARAH